MNNEISPKDLTDLVLQLGKKLVAANMSVATAESCSGGGIAYYMTEVAGSSDWFERAFVTYSNLAKQEMLNVDESILEGFGAVSEQTVSQMVSGALVNSPADIAVAVSGIAGPSGGSEDKPVGTVCFAWGYRDRPVRTSTHLLEGDRSQVRLKTIAIAIKGILANFSH
ncbi:MAG: CinA family protein [Thiohalomonadales bacterium]